MSARPTIHLTNVSSRKLHHGMVFNIMAAPRPWERLDGHVQSLTPPLEWLRLVQSGQITEAEYRRRYEAMISSSHPPSSCQAPGNLLAARGRAGGWSAEVVSDGDTLVCACSRAAAAAGRCHRVWAARFLVRSGWRVILDGSEVPA